MLLALGACQALPIDGPLAKDVQAEVQLRQRVPFRLVKLAADMVPILEEAAPDPESFIADLGPDEPRIGPGDTLVVTIVEPGGGGLFSGPPSISNTGAEPGARVVTLPEMSVDPDGRIAVPFADPIPVAGLTQVEAAGRVQDALAGQAVQPQVIVSDIRKVASRITVSGAVKSPGTLPLLTGGETLLGAVARAGGPAEAAENIVVQLTRSGNAHRVRLRTLLENPETDIHVRNGDYVHLLAQPQHYYVMGATERVQTGDLSIEKMRLTKALANAGGLLDSRADARAVMLLRYEKPDIMDRIAAVEARLARARGEDAPIPEDAPSHPPDAPAVPVVFMLDLRSASGLFMAQQLTVREEDIIYVPDSSYTQWKKFIDMVGITANPITGSGGAIGASAAGARNF
jgi:polysaccharide export outer membrane protein